MSLVIETVPINSKSNSGLHFFFRFIIFTRDQWHKGQVLPKQWYI